MQITIHEAAQPAPVVRGNGFGWFLGGAVAGLLLALALAAADQAGKDAAAKGARQDGARRIAAPVMPDMDLGEPRPHERLFELITADEQGALHTRKADFLPKLNAAESEGKAVLGGAAVPPPTPAGPGK